LPDFPERPHGREPSRALALRRAWVEHAIVLAYAALTGLVVVGFTLLTDAASAAFLALASMAAWAPYAALACTPAAAAALQWWTLRFAPATAGSGVPHVVLALERDAQGAPVDALVSLRLALHKIALVSGGLLAGLAIGREGPTVQVGAGVMHHARRWIGASPRVDGHDLMVAGAAAGIAAAFNTPLGGIVFAFEQLSKRRGMAHSTIIIASIVLAGLVAVSILGSETYFGRLPVHRLAWSMLVPGFVVCLAAGVAGGLFSRVLAALTGGRSGRWRARHPLIFAAVCAFGVALIGLWTGQATAGAGATQTRLLLQGDDALPAGYTAARFVATLLSACSGVPAGVFAPSLAIGAGLGRDVALLAGLPPEAAVPLVAIGMAAFLAAVTQGPMTAFIIVMEMVSGESMVLSMMAAALLASGVARLISPPLYETLAAALPGAAGYMPARR
jgi:H+/Cl- antiporter ClcA